LFCAKLAQFGNLSSSSTGSSHNLGALKKHDPHAVSDMGMVSALFGAAIDDG
jgi:hypothetical protein